MSEATLGISSRQPLALNVGTTGHRPNRLQRADMPRIRARVREALTLLHNTVRNLRDEGERPLLLRLLSALAEGTDRIVAQEAVPLGFELQGLLPFDRDEYEKDFQSAESRAEFRGLLVRATAIRELRGSRRTRETREAAYSAVGRQLLDGSDVLLAIWDGLGGRGKGGTTEVVAEAVERQIPTIWISSSPPHDARLLTAGGDVGLERLREELKRALRRTRVQDRLG